jgi:mannose-1-phosphate guanylyltransferase
MSSLVQIILAGGCGRRLYPVSSAFTPKQFIKVPGYGNLFQDAVMRAENIAATPVLVASNIRYRNNILSSLSQEQRTEFNFIFEPCQRGTFGAIIGAVAIAKDKFSDPVTLISFSNSRLDDLTEIKQKIQHILENFEDNTLYIINNKANDLNDDSLNDNFGFVLCRASNLLNFAKEHYMQIFEIASIGIKKAVVRENEISINYEDYCNLTELEFNRTFFDNKMKISEVNLSHPYKEILDFDDFFNSYQDQGEIKIDGKINDIDTRSFNKLSANYYLTNIDQNIYLKVKTDVVCRDNICVEVA